jgi:hypothetical protein
MALRDLIKRKTSDNKNSEDVSDNEMVQETTLTTGIVPKTTLAPTQVKETILTTEDLKSTQKIAPTEIAPSINHQKTDKNNSSTSSPNHNSNLDNDSIVQETSIFQSTKLKSGIHHSSMELPEELRDKYIYEPSKNNILNNGAEATSYICKDIKTAEKVVIKIYHRDRKTNSDVLTKLQQMSRENVSKYSKFLPEVIDFSDNWEVLKYIDGKDLSR